MQVHWPQHIPKHSQETVPQLAKYKQDQNLQEGSITPDIQKHESGQYRDASPHAQEACTAHLRPRPPPVVPTQRHSHSSQFPLSPKSSNRCLCFSIRDTLRVKPTARKVSLLQGRHPYCEEGTPTVRKASLPRSREPRIKLVKCHCCGPVGCQMFPLKHANSKAPEGSPGSTPHLGCVAHTPGARCTGSSGDKDPPSSGTSRCQGMSGSSLHRNSPAP